MMATGDDEFDDTQMVTGYEHTQVAGSNMFTASPATAPKPENKPTAFESTAIGSPALARAADRIINEGRARAAAAQDDDDIFESTQRAPNIPRPVIPAPSVEFTGMLDPTDRAPGAILKGPGATLQFDDFKSSSHTADHDDDLDEDSEPFVQTSVVPVMSDDMDALAVGSAIDGRFTITGVLGEGGMGKVYQGIQTSINREVAIKVVKQEFTKDPELRARFEREARLISSFTHPNIVRLVDYGESAGRLYLAMEFVNGRPISALFGKKKVQPRYALDMARQVASALIEAHTKGVVHRDLKPDNILVQRIADGTVQYKVLDFGVARTNTSDLTAAGAVCGTPQYMAPEQARGLKVEAGSDLYALGVMLFEMLCGKLPFEDVSPVKIMIRHVQEAPPRVRSIVPTIPQDVDDLVNALLAKEPRNRPQSSEELCERIDAIMAQHGWMSVVRVPAGPLTETTAEWSREPVAVAATPQARTFEGSGPLGLGLSGGIGQPLGLDPVEAARRGSMADTVDEESHWLGGGSDSYGLMEERSDAAGSNSAKPLPGSNLDFSQAALGLPDRDAPPVSRERSVSHPGSAPHTPRPSAEPTIERPLPRIASAPVTATSPSHAPVHVRPPASQGSNINMILGVALVVLVAITAAVAFFVVIKPGLGNGAAESGVATATGDAQKAFNAIADGGWEVGQVVPSSLGPIKLQSGKISRDGVTLSVSVYDCPTEDDIKNVFGPTILPAIAYRLNNTVVRVEPVGNAPRADVEQTIGFVANAMPGGELSNTNTR